MKWYLISKTFRGGRTKHYMFFSDDVEQEVVEGEIKAWGEYSNGGHESGYTLNWGLVDKVSAEVINSKIHKLNDQRESLMRKKLVVEFDIKTLQAELAKVKANSETKN